MSTRESQLKFIRLGLLALGWLCVGLGALGVVLPVLPTTPFLLVALWAFARSSQRFHHWLLTHKFLGSYVRDWEQYRIIPVRAKILSLTCMIGSLIYCVGFTDIPWYGLLGMVSVMLIGAVYILTKPSHRSDISLPNPAPKANG